MRILFTGVSSFTGYWFATALHEAGHEITAICTAAGLDDYDGVRRHRLDRLQGRIRLVFGINFGDDQFLGLLQEGAPYDAICHHGAMAVNHKADSFDVFAAVKQNTRNFSSVVSAARARGLRAFVITGSYFEADEGVGSEPLRAFSPYGLSKGLTWQIARFHGETIGVPMGKFVLPNPIGPLDQPRFLGYLLGAWASGTTPVVRTPAYVRDNVPVVVLAHAYADFVARTAADVTGGVLRSNPSGWIETVGDFSKRVSGRIRQISGQPCGVEFAPQTDFPEPRVRANSEPLLTGWSPELEESFWRELWEEYSR